MILVIDNYDSFTYNLVQYIGEFRPDIRVLRNDCFEPSDLTEINPSHIVVSPGPGRPADAGLSLEVIRTLGKKVPILGVCLGHQCIAEAYGGKVIKSQEIQHGKTSMIFHNRSVIFDGMENSFKATRYHSLVAERTSLPDELHIIAELHNGLVMGLEHISLPVFGVQFHPESIATENGMQIIENFLRIQS
ncbi:MAG: aminodeoxychorismate/anthranilate synthase component II [Candidatus Neomarinimicrobiota bacterium]|nr:aminodeoxychorismate/anthranilate synthase component II [Candidatus Neomarinimicrobiota bacterium]